MANNILTASVCSTVEQLARKIASYEGLIENSVQTFSYCINNPDVAAWFNNTDVGVDTLDKVKHNNEQLLELGTGIERVYQITMSLVHQSEEANRASGK